MPSGNVIFLNGTSSAGKSALATLLQDLFPQPYLHVSVDSFVSMLPLRVLQPETAPSEAQALVLQAHVERVLSGMHYCVAALAARGNNVIVDHVLESDEWLWECVGALHGVSVLFVGVRCALPELERREAARGDRMIGLARAQYPIIHANRAYDLNVDTSVHTFNDCAQQIKIAREHLSHPAEFDRIRATRQL